MFSYWSKFHVNIMTVSGVMIIFFSVDHKSGNQKYTCLSFAQYLGTEASEGYQIWRECL